MLSRCNRLKLGPGEQLVSRNQPFTHFSGLLGNHLDSLHQLVGMGEKELQVEHSRRIQQGDRCFEVPAFVAVRSSLISCAEIKQEFGGSRSLSHQLLLLSNTP
jgi:hypothetical protein